MNEAHNRINQYVGRRISARRIELNYSLEKFCLNSSISFVELFNIEEGKKPATAAQLFDLANLLHVPVGYFFEKEV